MANNIKITEFLPWAIEADTENEWIEILNDSDVPADLEGWQIDDQEGGSKPFVFKKGSLIAPNSFLVLPRASTKITLNNNGDSVRLLFPDNSIAQQIDYQKAKKGQSVAIFSDQDFYWTSFPTPGFTNFPPEVSLQENASVSLIPPLNNSSVKELVASVKKITLVPFIAPVQAKEDYLLDNLWQAVFTSTIDQEKNTLEGEVKNSLKTGTEVENKSFLKKSKERVLRGTFSKDNSSLIVLFVSLILSLSLFAFWFLRFFKK